MTISLFQALRVPLLGIPFWALLGCSTVSHLNPWHRNNDVTSLSIVPLPNANQRYAVDVDVVFIFDTDLAIPLAELTAQQWFAKKSDYLRAYPQSLKVVHSEPMPGLIPLVGDLPAKHARADKVLVFAHYLNQDLPHRMDITGFKNVRIVLQETTFTVENRL